MLKIKVLRVVGGMAECSYAYDSAFEQIYKRDTGAKQVDKADVGRYILSQLGVREEPTPKVESK